MEKPFVNQPHHKMIPRGTLPGIPLFGQRRSTELKLKSVSRRLFVNEHTIYYFIPAGTSLSLDKIAVTDITGSQPIAMSGNIL